MILPTEEQTGGWLRPIGAELIAETGFVLVHIPKETYGFIDRPVRYRQRRFEPKSELHITIVSQDGDQITRHLEKDPQSLGALRELVETSDWRFRKLAELYHVVEAPGVETIIQMVEVAGLEAFLSALSGLVGQGFLLPPAHVTLYTRGTEEGIGLPSQAVFQELVKGAVPPEELEFGEADQAAG